jgi:hypothetical protein
MTFDPFDPLSDDQIAKKDKASKEYLRRRKIIFDAFTTPQGAEFLKLLRSITIDKPFNPPSPKSADERVAFESAHAEKRGRDGLVKQILSQINQEKSHLDTRKQEKKHG